MSIKRVDIEQNDIERDDIERDDIERNDIFFSQHLFHASAGLLTEKKQVGLITFCFRADNQPGSFICPISLWPSRTGSKSWR